MAWLTDKERATNTVTNCDGPEHFDTRAEALAHASELVDDYRTEAQASNEWPSDVEAVEVHERKLIAQARQTSGIPRSTQGAYSLSQLLARADYCDYSLTPTEDRTAMSSSTTIKITTIEEARKWVGRTAYVGYGRVADAPPAHMSTEPALLTQPQPVPAGSFAFGGYSGGGPDYQGAIWIELLDGPAHPRPEGEGWVWCQTTEDAKPFVGKLCEVDAPAGTKYLTPRSTRGKVSHSYPWCISLGMSGLIALDDRGGAWIREAPVEAVDPVAVAHAACAEAWDLATSAEDEAKRLEKVFREVKAAAHLRKEREAEDARYPLREGWTWGKYANYKEIAAISQKQGRPCGVFVDPDGDLRQVWELNGSSYCDTYAPLDVARAVIARYDATRAND